MRAAALSIFLLTCMTGCASYRETLVAGHRYRLFFPHIVLATADGERIESVEVTVSCGRFRALTVIPDDWSADVVSPMSEQTTLRQARVMGLRHCGASEIWMELLPFRWRSHLASKSPRRLARQRRSIGFLVQI